MFHGATLSLFLINLTDLPTRITCPRRKHKHPEVESNFSSVRSISGGGLRVQLGRDEAGRLLDGTAEVEVEMVVIPCQKS